MVPEVYHSSLWRSRTQRDGTKWQRWELSDCAVRPRPGRSCQTPLPDVRLSCLDKAVEAKWRHPATRRALHISLFSALAAISQQSEPLDVGSDFGILKQIKMKNELCQGRLRVRRRPAKKQFNISVLSNLLGILSPRKNHVWNTLTDKCALFHMEIYRERG